ncbi:hypothetical protein ACQKGC_25475 [Allorhizobium pseudoryzae]|uniref:hypothetical protein n=1 Tax=Allorhizobium pseudoryzae TaxID=379684 RepID=UPI003CFC962C
MLATTRTDYGPNLLVRLLDASSPQKVEDYAKAAWVLNGEGLIPDGEMAYLVPMIEHQRKVMAAAAQRRDRRALTVREPHRRATIPPAKRNSAWLRRRALAKDCIIPTCLAKYFTVSKLAVLAVIARAVMEKGSSNMSLPEIAARAGVGCTTARYAIRDASQMGLISVRENRQNATWNRPNTIQIICKRWRNWLVGYRNKVASGFPNGKVLGQAAGPPLRNLSPTIEKVKYHFGWPGSSAMQASSIWARERTSDPP